VTVSTCEHYGKGCPGHHCTCKCDSCCANVVEDISRSLRKEEKDARKKGKGR
jgi:hypothetical protein